MHSAVHKLHQINVDWSTYFTANVLTAYQIIFLLKSSSVVYLSVSWIHSTNEKKSQSNQLRIELRQMDTYIQLFRQKLSHESVKAYATMPIGIMGSKSLALLD